MTAAWMTGFRAGLAAVVLGVFCACPAGAAARTADAGKPFGRLPLVAEVRCAEGGADVPFAEYPKSVSKVETILGKPCRVLPNDAGEAKYFAYRIGQGAGLKAGGCYLLSVELPDDRPRTVYICNWGCETARGVHTGATVGDCLKGRYVNNNPESLDVPLSGGFITWRSVFFLHDRFCEIPRPRGRTERPLVPADGFWVIVAQPRAINAPLSSGAAVATIRLFDVGDWRRFAVKINYPPAGLPRRGLLFREEMSDGVVALGHRAAEKDPKLRGVAEPVKWFEYKARLMRMLGMNTYCKDLLEFGHNQGWDSGPHGGSAWYNASSTPMRWQRILTMLGKYDLDVLPYYEYAGSIGQDKTRAIGSQRRCRRLDGKQDYTHISWVHKTNADLADEDFIADARKVLELTIVRHKDKARFVGAWFRPRPEGNPISFNDKNLQRFSREARGGTAVRREDLQGDKALLGKYYQWWFEKRLEFNEALAAYLRKEVNPQAVVLYTTDSSEPGRSLPPSVTAVGKKNPWQWKTVVVNDDPAGWARRLAAIEDKDFRWHRSIGFDEVVSKDMHLKALVSRPGTWGKWEWHHAVAWADPQNYRRAAGSMLTCSFHRLYSVSSPGAFEAFRTPSGLAIVRHYALNENEMFVGKENILGYFVADVERAGPYSMLAEARAMAHGDPRFIGYLVGNSFARGFPSYARDFNAAFLSLPALPSRVVTGAASDAEVVVRLIDANRHGTWLAVVNTSLRAKKGVAVALPAAGKVTDAATGSPVAAPGGKLTLSLYPGQLRTFHVPAAGGSSSLPK